MVGEPHQPCPWTSVFVHGMCAAKSYFGGKGICVSLAINQTIWCLIVKSYWQRQTGRKLWVKFFWDELALNSDNAYVHYRYTSRPIAILHSSLREHRIIPSLFHSILCNPDSIFPIRSSTSCYCASFSPFPFVHSSTISAHFHFICFVFLYPINFILANILKYK